MYVQVPSIHPSVCLSAYHNFLWMISNHPAHFTDARDLLCPRLPGCNIF